MQVYFSLMLEDICGVVKSPSGVFTRGSVKTILQISRTFKSVHHVARIIVKLFRDLLGLQ